MKVESTTLPGVLTITPTVWEDTRGFFYESFNERLMSDAGIKRNWVQDNHSKSQQGVLRGLHYQLQQPQAKLVRVTAGAVYDVVVDVRLGSPHFGQWLDLELSAENKKMLFIPEGFAHGFFSLENGTEFLYKCSDFYNKEAERGIIWNDPELAIPWPIENESPRISEKDLQTTWLSKTDQADLPRFQG